MSATTSLTPAGPLPGPFARRRLLWLFLALEFLLLVSLAATYLSGQHILNVNREAQVCHRAIAAWRALLAQMQDAETGQRGYVITGDDTYLSPYHRALEQLNDVSALPPPPAGQPDLREAISARWQEKAAELERTIALQRAGRHEDAVALVRSNEGKTYMDQIRGLAERAESQQEQSLVAARDNIALATGLRNIVFAALAVIYLLFLPWVYGRIKREIAGRRRAQEERDRQRELLAVTLTSIGDAVIVTDTEARVTYLNSAAERLTGWTQAEARQRPCAEIFRIINEETRQPVESPVDKVLRDGRIVGLANHTLLLRRDGSEVPIDDSGAPIRDGDQGCVGVVLVFRDFSEHKNAERALRAASAAKDRFLAALSHELRTPLTPLLATLSCWEDSPDFPATWQPEVRMLRRNVEFEARLIDDLLDLTRIAKGKLHLERQVVDAHEIVKAAAAIIVAELRGRGLALELRLDAAAHHVRADATRLQQVLLNLLKNAVKFTPAGRITVSTSQAAEGGLRLAVADTGIGMAPEVMAKLFHYFEQGSETVTRRFGGLGLGLALSHALVEAHEGGLTAESPGEGLGSCFTISLPTVAAPPLPAGAAPAGGAVVFRMAPLRILLVEDHADTLHILQRLFGRAGHRIQGVGTVAAATELITAEPFDLLISDLGLPDGSGLDLIRRVRPGFSKPAIALSGYGLEEDIDRCRAAGFDAHLTKPVQFETLHRLIGQLVSSPPPPTEAP